MSREVDDCGSDAQDDLENASNSDGSAFSVSVGRYNWKWRVACCLVKARMIQKYANEITNATARTKTLGKCQYMPFSQQRPTYNRIMVLEFNATPIALGSYIPPPCEPFVELYP